MANGMEAGELELRKIFEETTNKNLNAVLDYCKKTRELVREQEAKLESLRGQLDAQNKTYDQLRLQLSSILQKMYNSGT